MIDFKMAMFDRFRTAPANLDTTLDVLPLGRVYNITYLPWKQSPAGAFDQVSHFGIRIPFDVIGKRH